MLHLISSIFSSRMPTPEQWAQRNAGITTPDRIIAAAIAQSIARDHTAWQATGNFEHASRDYQYDDTAKLHNSAKKVTVIFGQRQWRSGEDYHRKYNTKPRLKGTTVDGMEISPDDALIIWVAWEKIGRRLKAIAEAEAKALANMRRNEQAWDMVEKLLDMKRNEHGALVPVQTVEEECLPSTGLTDFDGTTASNP